MYSLASCACVEDGLPFVGRPELKGGVGHDVVAALRTLSFHDRSFGLSVTLFLLFPLLLRLLDHVHRVEVQNVVGLRRVQFCKN